ncbi:hypothetical protein ACOMHN_021608 [Nucella lapillus]
MKPQHTEQKQEGKNALLSESAGKQYVHWRAEDHWKSLTNTYVTGEYFLEACQEQAYSPTVSGQECEMFLVLQNYCLQSAKAYLQTAEEAAANFLAYMDRKEEKDESLLTMTRYCQLILSNCKEEVDLELKDGFDRCGLV